jgi:hypothetical protein
MIAIAIVGVTMLLTVGIHYEALSTCSRLLPRLPGRPRIHAAFAILGGLAAHIVEILVWSLAIGSAQAAGIGGLVPETRSAPDIIYFAIVSYTSLGYGDLNPVGPLRLIASFASLTGLVMIAWTASFTYMQMQRFWTDR